MNSAPYLEPESEKTTAPDEAPLVVRVERHVVDEGGADQFMKSAYVGTLLVGTPPIEMTVVFDTGSGMVVLPSMYCKSETCRMHKRYKRSGSVTGRDINFDGQDIERGVPRDSMSVSYGTGEISGVVIEDLICAGGVVRSPNASESLQSGCIRMRFLAATVLSDDPFSSFSFDGIVGMGLNSLSQSSEFNFVSAITQSLGGSSQQMFGVFLSDNPREESELALGGYTQAHLQEDLSWGHVHDPELGHWILTIRSIRVGGTVLDFCEDGTCKAAVDTGTSLFVTPKAAFRDIFELLRHPAPPAGHCQGSGPLLHVELDEFTVTLGPREYAQVRRARPRQQHQSSPHFTESKDVVRKDLRCFPTLMTLDLPEPLGPKLFIFGESVLRKYYTVYDALRKTVGFGRAVHNTVPSREDLLVRSVDLGGPRKGARIPTMFDVFRWRRALRRPLTAWAL